MLLPNTSFDPPLPGVNSSANSEPPPDRSCTEPLSALIVWAFETIALPGSARSGMPLPLVPPVGLDTNEAKAEYCQVLAAGTLPLLTLPKGTTPEPATEVTLPDVYFRSVVTIVWLLLSRLPSVLQSKRAP